MLSLSRHLERGEASGHQISIEQWEHGILLDAFLWIRVRRAVALPVLTLVAAAALGDEVVQENSVLHVLTVVQVVLVRFAGAVYRFVNLVTALIFLVILVVVICKSDTSHNSVLSRNLIQDYVP